MRRIGDHGRAGGAALSLLLCSAVAEAGTSPPVKSLSELRQDHVLIQKWDLSCGAAALATLLRYQHGDPVNERDVAIGLMGRAEYLEHPELVQLREGFSLLDLKRYVDSRGFKGTAFGKLDLSHLDKLAPVIVPINARGYSHFVIFRGLERNRVLLADPAWGNRTMPTARFMSEWVEYPQVGRVGFVIGRRDGQILPDVLAPTPGDFLTFN